MKFIKITLNKSKEELVAIFEEAPKVLITRLFEIENEIKNITLHQEPCVVFMTPNINQELEVLNLYHNLGLNVKVEDLSQEALFNFHNSVDSDVITAINSEWQFKELVTDYILNNSNIDYVLDKINLHGIGSLIEADKQFLNKI